MGSVPLFVSSIDSSRGAHLQSSYGKLTTGLFCDFARIWFEIRTYSVRMRNGRTASKKMTEILLCGSLLTKFNASPYILKYLLTFRAFCSTKEKRI